MPPKNTKEKEPKHQKNKAKAENKVANEGEKKNKKKQQEKKKVTIVSPEENTNRLLEAIYTNVFTNYLPEAVKFLLDVASLLDEMIASNDHSKLQECAQRCAALEQHPCLGTDLVLVTEVAALRAMPVECRRLFGGRFCILQYKDAVSRLVSNLEELVQKQQQQQQRFTDVLETLAVTLADGVSFFRAVQRAYHDFALIGADAVPQLRQEQLPARVGRIVAQATGARGQQHADIIRMMAV